MSIHARISDDAWADEQVQQAIKVLSDHHAREWERHRPAREVNARKEIAAWLEHEAGCIRRARDYEAEAASLPKAHKDYAGLLILAAKQRDMADWARSRIVLAGRDL